MIDLNSIAIKKDSRQKENQNVLNKIVKFIEENTEKTNVAIFKNWGSVIGRSGRPDLEIVYNKNTWYIECKDPKGFVSTLQAEKIERFKNIGVTIYVVNDVKDFKERVWKIMNE